jgi:hypothetical protein
MVVMFVGEEYRIEAFKRDAEHLLTEVGAAIQKYAVSVLLQERRTA